MKTQKRPFGAYYTAFLAFTQPKIAQGSGFLCFSAGMKNLPATTSHFSYNLPGKYGRNMKKSQNFSKISKRLALPDAWQHQLSVFSP